MSAKRYIGTGLAYFGAGLAVGLGLSYGVMTPAELASVRAARRNNALVLFSPKDRAEVKSLVIDVASSIAAFGAAFYVWRALK